MTIYLPDVNLWLALVSRRHSHHDSALAWLEKSEETLGFCRITQMSLLRLLTHTQVMGVDVLTQTKAWEIYSKVCANPRVGFYSEPNDFEQTWRSLTQLSRPATNAWTDAYLVAFAKIRGFTLVSFDQDIGKIAPEVPVVTLS